MRLCEGRWSEGLVSDAVWVSGQTSFAQVEAILARLRGVSIWRCSVWRHAQECGERFAAIGEQERQRAQVPPGRWEPATGPRLGVALDGTMVHLREEGWKEVKVGSVYEVAVQPGRDEHTGEMVALGRAVQMSYVAHLGGPEAFGEMLWAQAWRRGWLRSRDSLVLGDGAVWIWNLAGLHFGDSRQLVDWYHADEHLALAASVIHGEGTPAAKRWLREQETRLYQGEAASIAEELWQQAEEKGAVAGQLSREAGYFRNNQHRMNYLEMREEEWPIGSGMVESAAKQVKERLTGPGMMWSRSGAEHMLPIRTAIMGQRFDALWHSAYHLPLN